MTTLALPTDSKAVSSTDTTATAVNRKNTSMQTWRRTHQWMPTPEQDMAEAPPWATTVGAQSFREGQHGRLCSGISSGALGPVLVRRTTRFAPRHPVYAIPYSLWIQVCQLYPDLRPPQRLIGKPYPAQEYRQHLAQDIFDPAFHRGQHSFVQSWNLKDPWYVAFVPRMWFEEVYARLKRDGRLDLVG